MKHLFLTALTVIAAFSIPGQVSAAHVWEPQIMAFIHMHKTLYADAVKAQEMTAVSTAEHAYLKEKTDKVQKYREMLDKRLNDVSDWASLSVVLFSLSMDMVELARECEDFIHQAGTLCRRNPAAAFQYYKACRYIKDEIKRAEKILTVSGLMNGGLMKATMEQKATAIFNIKSVVSNIRSAISSALWQCRWLLGDKLSIQNIRDILTDEEVKSAAKKVIADWKNNHVKDKDNEQ